MINLDQLEGVTSIAGPGIDGDPSLFIDMNRDPSNWADSPTTNIFECDESAYMTVDLGRLQQVAGVTIWHYYGNDRAYCNQKLALSASGIFGGEEHVMWETGTGYGPPESEDGNSISFEPTVTRYVRHWCGRSTADGGVHFMEIDVYGVNQVMLAAQPNNIDCCCVSSRAEFGDSKIMHV